METTEAANWSPEIDLDYVGTTGAEIAVAIEAGRPIEVNYQPGDGSCYGLFFVPLTGIDAAPGRLTATSAGTDTPTRWSSKIELGLGSRPRGSCLIAWIGNGAAALDLSRGPGAYVGGYLGQHFPTASRGSLHAIEILFDAVATGLTEES